MGYRVGIDASHKIKSRDHGTRLIMHVARDVDVRRGVRRVYTNTAIDRDRCARLNETWVPASGVGGGWSRVASLDEVQDRLSRRLAVVDAKNESEGLRRRRADAVIMRPLVLQLSPAYFDEHDPEWRERGLSEQSRAYYDVLRQVAADEFGEENIVCASLHMDEALPQWQILMTPVTEDGRLSQKDFFKGPSHLRGMHQRLRQRVSDAGLDVELASSARSTEHLSDHAYQRQMDQAREQQLEDLDLAAEQIEDLTAELGAREARLSMRELRLIQRESGLRAREARLEEAQQALEAGQARLRDDEGRLDAAVEVEDARLDERETRLDERERELGERETSLRDQESRLAPLEAQRLQEVRQAQEARQAAQEGLAAVETVVTGFEAFGDSAFISGARAVISTTGIKLTPQQSASLAMSRDLQRQKTLAFRQTTPQIATHLTEARTRVRDDVPPTSSPYL